MYPSYHGNQLLLVWRYAVFQYLRRITWSTVDCGVSLAKLSLLYQIDACRTKQIGTRDNRLRVCPIGSIPWRGTPEPDDFAITWGKNFFNCHINYKCRALLFPPESPWTAKQLGIKHTRLANQGVGERRQRAYVWFGYCIGGGLWFDIVAQVLATAVTLLKPKPKICCPMETTVSRCNFGNWLSEMKVTEVVRVGTLLFIETCGDLCILPFFWVCMRGRAPSTTACTVGNPKKPRSLALESVRLLSLDWVAPWAIQSILREDSVYIVTCASL